ncbi:MAG TPA: hypothetical protein ENI68_05360 [Gammaproteobacteria bacterium]|nr:hypothetical protein [Gammaproteobacteria bacterium]
MSHKIRVALLGLGDVGEDFAEHFLEKIQEGHRPIEIVAVAHHHTDSPVALGFSQNGVPVYEDATEVIKMGENVDIIFDLTGSAEVRQSLRKGMVDSANKHSVIAPEVFASLLQMFFADDVLFEGKAGGY